MGDTGEGRLSPVWLAKLVRETSLGCLAFGAIVSDVVSVEGTKQLHL